MKRDVVIHNFIFPTSMLYFILVASPPALVFVLAANFIVDSLMLFLMFFLLKLPEKKTLYKKAAVHTWLYGFAADFIASFGIFAAHFALDERFGLHLDLYHVAPWKNPSGFLFVTTGIILAGILIYVFQRRWVLKGIKLEKQQRHRLALGMAILTAPYLMYLPPIR